MRCASSHQRYRKIILFENHFNSFVLIVYQDRVHFYFHSVSKKYIIGLSELFYPVHVNYTIANIRFCLTFIKPAFQNLIYCKLRKPVMTTNNLPPPNTLSSSWLNLLTPQWPLWAICETLIGCAVSWDRASVQSEWGWWERRGGRWTQGAPQRPRSECWALEKDRCEVITQTLTTHISQFHSTCVTLFVSSQLFLSFLTI